MIESFARRRPDHDQHIFLVDAEFAQRVCEVRIRLEIGEVDVFLNAFVTMHLAERSPILTQFVRGKSTRHDYLRRQTKSQVIGRLMLVIHQRDGFDSERGSRGDVCI